MNRKRFCGALLALAALTILSVFPASAACIPPKFMATYNPGTSAYAYWQPAAGDDVTGTTLTGRFWRLGNRVAGNEGGCSVPTGGT